MHRYLDSAKRLWPLLVLVLALVWVPGLVAAYSEYVTTFESAATVWVDRATAQYSISGSDNPSLGTQVAPGAEQAEIFSQLMQTNSFLEEVVNRTSARPQLAAARDKEQFFADIRKRFRAQALGTNLLRVSYRASEPGIAAEMVAGALVARETRVKAARTAATNASISFYQKEFEIAQGQALTSQRDLDVFNGAHPGKLSSSDEYQQSQLRLAVEVAQSRLNDLRQRLDRGAVSTALLDMAESLNFQVIDQPRAEPFPSGGLRTASLIAGVAFAAGLALASLVLALSVLLSDKITSRADVDDFLRDGLFGVVRHVDGRGDLRAALASAAFLPVSPLKPAERRTA